MTKIIECQQLSYRYSDQEPAVIDIEQWELAAGEQLFLFGDSGSGKSTLLKLLSGIIVADKGELKIAGTHLSTLSARQRDQFRANHIGVVFQQLNLIPYLSVIDNILLASHIAANKQAKVDVKTLLEKVNIAEQLWHKPATELSLGQQQRVAIVRALINKPQLLLMDEPTSALDENNKQQFLSLLFELLSEQQTSLVFISHDQHLKQHFSQSMDLTSINKCAHSRVVS